MLEGFQPTAFSISAKSGRPARAPSYRLRNLAWIRRLLDSLDQVRHWSGAVDGRRDAPAKTTEQPSITPVPASWTTRPSDAALLKQCFSAMSPIPEEELERAPSLLDELFGPLFGGAEGASGRYFSDRIARGLASPDATRLRRLDDLVPGSRRAFENEPADVDPWFYDALDFTSPWFAKVFLWRTMDPSLEDPGWDELLMPGSGLGRAEFTDAVRDHQFADYTVSAADVRTFEAMIEHAAALATYPDLASAPVEEIDDAIARLLAEVPVGGGRVAVDLSKGVGRLPPERQWLTLSNAIAARRVSSMLGVAHDLTVWWLNGVHRSLTVAFRELEEKSYARLPKGRSPVDDVVERVL